MTNFIIAIAALALPLAAGLEADAFGCQDSTSCQQGTSLLQHGSRKVESANRQGQVIKATADPTKFLDWAVNIDANGRSCALCGLPPQERAPNNTYVQRTDCGNQSLYEHPDKVFLPLSSFMKEATDEHNETFGWCELNSEKGCADAIYNKDYLMFAKSVQLPSLPIVGYKTMAYDQQYCLHNGWLAPEIKALQHDFEGMTAKGKEYCNSDLLVSLGSKGNMTLMDMIETYLIDLPGLPISRPSPEHAHFMAAWTCAMGSSACDMTYCAYSFCVQDDGSIGTYDECPGWDPVKGMPVN